MQRILHSDTYYNFYSEVIIEDNRISFKNLVPEELYGIYHEQGKLPLKVSINSIVGENGSGKSTIIDYVIRILNNLATVILGEHYRNPSAEHLHYIQNVHAELFVLIENIVYRITCIGEEINVTLYCYSEASKSFEKKQTEFDIHTRCNDLEPICEEPNSFGLLRRLCYTIVVNYSLYSFDSENYKDEMTGSKKESNIRSVGFSDGYEVDLLREIRNKDRSNNTKKGEVEACSWLHGLFHKNDGYQVPLVITPMRKYGSIDLRRESKLAEERLLSLVFRRDAEGRNVFNRINKKLYINGIRIRKDENEAIKYEKKSKQNDLFPKMSAECLEKLWLFVKDTFSSEFDIKDAKRSHIEVVWNYIIYKFFKIIYTYPRYAKIRSVLNEIKEEITDQEKEYIKEVVLEILHDHTHVTRKIFRSLYYLKYDHLSKKYSFRIEELTKTILEYIDKRNNGFFYPPRFIDELLPPPIFQIELILYDIEDTKYKNAIPFSSLSSGEKQVTYTLTSFYYHLLNIDSISNYDRRTSGYNYKHQNKKKKTTDLIIEYRHATVIFDEIELYFHPEMQRTFVATLMDGLKQLQFNQIRSLQLIFVTHSPFILSDIPYSNTLFLGKNGAPYYSSEMKTFGANIHTILRHSFFLEKGAMGEFAQTEINEVVKKMNFYKLRYQLYIIQRKYTNEKRSQKLDELRDNNYRLIKSLSNEQRKEIMSSNCSQPNKLEEVYYLEYVSSLISIIQEPIVKVALQNLYQEILNYVEA